MILQHFRYALRTLSKSPAMALTAIATLAIGIGANTALFTVIDTVLLRPMNYPHPEAVGRDWNRYSLRIVPGVRKHPRRYRQSASGK